MAHLGAMLTLTSENEAYTAQDLRVPAQQLGLHCQSRLRHPDNQAYDSLVQLRVYTEEFDDVGNLSGLSLPRDKNIFFKTRKTLLFPEREA